ncbi:MAG: hypothetical protein LBJ96_05545 [Holosporaceae bacterium]|jgi:hypothetical protein|nr:hypothetical protein [Holosporaceae bacterium]
MRQAALLKLPLDSPLIDALRRTSARPVIRLDVRDTAYPFFKKIYATKIVQQALIQKKRRSEYGRELVPPRDDGGIDILSAALEKQSLKKLVHQPFSSPINAEILVASLSELMENAFCLRWGVFNPCRKKSGINTLCFGVALEISDGAPTYYNGGEHFFDEFLFILFQFPFSGNSELFLNQAVTVTDLYTVKNSRELKNRFSGCVAEGSIPIFELREVCKDLFDSHVCIDIEKRRLETAKEIVLRKTEEYQKIGESLLASVNEIKAFNEFQKDKIDSLSGINAKYIPLPDVSGAIVEDVRSLLEHMSTIFDKLDQKREALSILTEKEFVKSNRSFMISSGEDFDEVKQILIIDVPAPKIPAPSDIDRFKNEIASIPLQDPMQVYSLPSNLWSLDPATLRKELRELEESQLEIFRELRDYYYLSNDDSSELNRLLKNAHDYRCELARLEIEKGELSKILSFLNLRNKILKEFERLNSAIANVEERIAEATPPSLDVVAEIPESLNNEKEAEEATVSVQNEGSFLWRFCNFMFGFWR